MNGSGRRATRFTAPAAALLVVAACVEELVMPGVVDPEIQAATVIHNPRNALSVLVMAHVRLADSVAVRYGIAGEAPALADVSAAVVPVADSVLIPVLGLFAETSYELQVVAYGSGAAVAGETLSTSTGRLPDDLPEYVARGSDPSPGYVAFAAGPYGLVIDNSGRVVWYHRFVEGPGLNFQAQPTGRFVARPAASEPMQFAEWIEIDPLGNTTRTLGCVGGLHARFHDLISSPDGSYWIMCDETRTVDLTNLGGHATARVTGTVVQHVSGSGELLFHWTPFDHFDIADLEPADRGGLTVNWTHGNALDLDADGNLLISFRNLSEISKIDTHTGAVVWRLGGPHNEFAFKDATVPAFARQHGLRVTGPGQLLLLDNLGNPAGSSAQRYAFDEAEYTVRLTGSYGSLPPVTALLGGTTQDLPGGRTLVSYGSGGRVEEYDAAGAVVWRIEGDAGYVFRAQRIRSLYHPGIGLSR